MLSETQEQLNRDADDVFYDAKQNRVYAICGAGVINVIRHTDPNTYKSLTKVDTAKGARTGLFVPEQDTLLSPFHIVDRSNRRFVAITRTDSFGSIRADWTCWVDDL
jgi:hypothetical protein